MTCKIKWAVMMEMPEIKVAIKPKVKRVALINPEAVPACSFTEFKLSPARLGVASHTPRLVMYTQSTNSPRPIALCQSQRTKISGIRQTIKPILIRILELMNFCSRALRVLPKMMAVAFNANSKLNSKG